MQAREFKPGQKAIISYPMEDGYIRTYRYKVRAVHADRVDVLMVRATHSHPVTKTKFRGFSKAVRHYVSVHPLQPMEPA